MRRFAFRLALASGYWVYNPDEMLEAMPARIFEEWLAYHQEEPFGQLPFRVGYASAMLGTLLAKPRGKRAWEPSDFMPDGRREKPPATPDQQFGKLLMIATVMGAEIRDPKGKLGRMIEGA